MQKLNFFNDGKLGIKRKIWNQITQPFIEPSIAQNFWHINQNVLNCWNPVFLLRL